MSQYSLDVLRQRYVVEKRPLEASIEQILRADTRAGARAILASIDKRRFENSPKGSASARCSASRPLSGKAAITPWQALTRPE
jgi:hypothetical protein